MAQFPVGKAYTALMEWARDNVSDLSDDVSFENRVDALINAVRQQAIDAAAQGRERNVRSDLTEMAEFAHRKDVYLGVGGSISGVVMPRDLLEGTILTPNYARKIGAQLILQADLHDEIAGRDGS